MKFHRLLSGAVVLAPSLSLGAAATPPATRTSPVTDTYHGTTVTDPYRWLENWEDTAVKAWSESENTYARAYLDNISFAPVLHDRIDELETAVGPRYLEVVESGGKYFASKALPDKQQPVIVVLDSLAPGAKERVVVDPNELDEHGGTSFDWFHPSPDGRLLAVSLSSGGSEAGDARIFEVATGTERTGDRVAHVNGGTAGGSLSWTNDSSGFFYSRYPRVGERPEADLDFYTQVYFHKLGTDEITDSYQTGEDYPKIAEIHVEVSPSGRWTVTNVQNGDGGEFIQDVRTPEGDWVRLSTYEDRIVEAKFGDDDSLYLVSRKNAPMGKVMRLPLFDHQTPSLADAKEVVPEQPDASIETDFSSRSGITLSGDRLFVLYQVGGPNELRVFALNGSGAIALGPVDSLPISTVSDVAPFGDNGVVYANQSYIMPTAWYTLTPEPETPGVGRVEPTALKQALPPHMPELEVRREFATSKDGTKVPVNIIARREIFTAWDARKARDAQGTALFELRIGREKVRAGVPAPTVLYGYGGYGVCMTPGFSRRIVVFCEQGGIYAIANIRGGGEYGERWHLEGNLTKKQNVFDDFQAAARYLSTEGYTSPGKLAIFGGSNGGLLMGATFTQDPGICKAVVSAVGIYDMLRVELSPNGAFNITEFGTVKNKPEFDALYAYSPYHRVKEGQRYPAILFLTGANDPRVDPMQSRKMTALLQAAQATVPGNVGGPSPVYLRTSGNTGHGMGTPLSARIDETTDTFAFIFDQLGVKYVDPRN